MKRKLFVGAMVVTCSAVLAATFFINTSSKGKANDVNDHFIPSQKL